VVTPVGDDFFETLGTQAEDPNELAAIPTQVLLDEFMRRVHQGEAVPPINHWISCRAALDLLREHGYSKTPLHRAWFLDTAVRALAGDAEYAKWVANFEKNGRPWSVGERPENR
jgi:hypothetical protein